MKVNITIPDKWYDREGEKNLAYQLIDLENDALARFFDVDMSGYRKLWSSRNFTYFDANTVKPVIVNKTWREAR